MAQNTSAVKRWLETLSSIAVIIASGAVVYMAVDRAREGTGSSAVARPKSPAAVVPKTSAPISIIGFPQKGERDAAVAVIEYSDFQCPFCAKFTQQIFPEIEKQYIQPGKVLWAFRHLPLESIHPVARDAALGAECAHRQKQFWPMHDNLFIEPKTLSRERILRVASKVGLDMAEFITCVNSSASAEAVKADVAAAHNAGISGTPTFLVGRMKDGIMTATEVLAGPRPPSDFGAAIERARTSNVQQ